MPREAAAARLTRCKSLTASTLLQNLAEALELAFTGHARGLRDAEQARRQDAAADGSPVRPDPPPPPKVLRYLNRLRDAQRGAAPHRPRMQTGPPLVAAPKLVLTPRTAAWTVLRR